MFGFAGTMMRHYFRFLGTIVSLPSGVIQPPLWTFLVTFRGSSLGFQACGQRAVNAIDVTSITATADHGLCTAPGAAVEPRSVMNRI